MLITPKIYNDMPDIKFNEVSLEWVDSFKYVGLYIDKNLNFNYHIDILCNNLNKMKGVIYSVSTLVPQNVLIKLYQSLVYPVLINNVIIWGNSTQSNEKKICVILNKILRIILKVKYNENHVPLISTNYMYKQLNFMKFTDIYKYFLLKFAHYILYTNADLFNYCIKPHLSENNYDTRHWINLPYVRTDVEKRFAEFQMCKLLSDLPQYLINDMTPYLLKRNFKSYVLNGH